MYNLIPLQLMRSGETACVAEVLGAPEALHRLTELGLQKGVKIQMLQPGAPCIIRLGESKLCLRHEELSSVLVSVS